MKHFVRPSESYQRRLNPIGDAQQAYATFLIKHRPEMRDRVPAFIRKHLNTENGISMKMPRARVLVRQANGDRKMEVMRFDHFLSSAIKSKRILAPTLTVYENPSVKRSLIGEYLRDNLDKRKAAKHEMFVAEMAGDKIRRAIKNAEQNTLKIKNNSMSGAHSSPHTILFNKSSHSTLTSTCRAATSYGNANNEKFLMGNRHYYSPDIVQNNIISICTLSDLKAIEAVAQRYQLRTPTVDEVMACIKRSTDPYWRSDLHMGQIHATVQTLTDMERMAFMFVGDLYHTAQINPTMVRSFLGRLSLKATAPMHGSTPTEEQQADRKAWMKRVDSNLTSFVFMLCSKETDGRQLKDIPLESDDYGILAQTAKMSIETLDLFEDFIQAFWVTDNMPSSVYQMPSIVRQTAITSDTDSTIFTVQYWPKWFCGQADFTEESIAIAQVVVFFSAETIRHILAMFSANLGAETQEIHRLSMKNEYYFPVFCLTSRAKHYFAYISAQEGNVFKKMKQEIKGVGLRSSNVPASINNQAASLMRYYKDTVMRGEKISLTRALRAVAKVEQGIIDQIRSGGFELLSSLIIKTRETYTNPDKSNYQHYELWESVFAPKYGPAPAPPYMSIKVNLTSDNRTRYREWLAEIEDRELAARLDAWMVANGRKELAVLRLPQEILAVKGMPEEVIPAANVRNLIANTMGPFYTVLETIGYFIKNKNNTRLVSDERWLLADDWPLPELELSSEKY